MKKFRRTLPVLLGLLALYTAAQIPVPTTKNDSSSANAAMEDAQVGNPENGATVYEKLCSKCHGSGGTGGFAPSHVGCDICGDYPALVIKIEDDMPKGNPEVCTGECASDTAAFIYVDLNGHNF